MQQPIDVTPTRPIFYREKDGLMFEPDVRLGLVRCSQCLALLSVSATSAHACDGLMLVLSAVARESEVPHG